MIHQCISLLVHSRDKALFVLLKLRTSQSCWIQDSSVSIHGHSHGPFTPVWPPPFCYPLSYSEIFHPFDSPHCLSAMGSRTFSHSAIWLWNALQPNSEMLIHFHFSKLHWTWRIPIWLQSLSYHCNRLLMILIYLLIQVALQS